MFGIDLALAFFAGLVWWELVLFGVMVLGSGIALSKESSLGFFIAFGILFFMPWTGAGSLWASISLLDLIYYFIGFILAGIGWSFFKWKLFVQDIISRYSDRGKEYTKQDVKDEINYRKDYDTIIYWITLWPFSLLGYFLNDFVYNLVKSIVDRIYTVYDRITDNLLDKSNFSDSKSS
jgi:hypothetical protein